jgi:preprotein translocase subunit Sec63
LATGFEFLGSRRPDLFPGALPLTSSPPSYYQLLQVQQTASPQELRQAFRGLSKRYHPDTTVLPAGEAAAAFQLLQQAYGVLSDPALRQRYDDQLRPPLSPTSPFAPPPQTTIASRPASVRRDLSGGELLALLLLGFALVLSLVLGVGVAWMRGAQLVQSPSWWPEVASTNVTGLEP